MTVQLSRKIKHNRSLISNIVLQYSLCSYSTGSGYLQNPQWSSNPTNTSLVCKEHINCRMSSQTASVWEQRASRTGIKCECMSVCRSGLLFFHPTALRLCTKPKVEPPDVQCTQLDCLHTPGPCSWRRKALLCNASVWTLSSTVFRRIQEDSGIGLERRLVKALLISL